MSKENEPINRHYQGSINLLMDQLDELEIEIEALRQENEILIGELNEYTKARI